MARKCDGEGCTYDKAWAFRQTKHTKKWLCDICWGHLYGEETCAVCEKNCYPEDEHVCGSCRAHEVAMALDQSIDADMEHARHGI